MKIFSRVVIIALLVFSVFSFSKVAAQFLLFGNPLEGKSAPEFTLPTLKHASMSLSEYREDQPAILFFWATWCVHCRSAIKDLSREHSTMQAKGIKLVVIDIGEPKSHVVAYLQRAGIDLDMFLDENNSVSEQYRIVGVPTFVFVNAEGIVTAVKHGLETNYERFLFSEQK